MTVVKFVAAHVLGRSGVWLYQPLWLCISDKQGCFAGVYHTRSLMLVLFPNRPLVYVTLVWSIPVLQCETVSVPLVLSLKVARSHLIEKTNTEFLAHVYFSGDEFTSLFFNVNHYINIPWTCCFLHQIMSDCWMHIHTTWVILCMIS